ncbi:MAG: hypothetical protein AB1492_03750 [Bacillota bacterium]
MRDRVLAACAFAILLTAYIWYAVPQEIQTYYRVTVCSGAGDILRDEAWVELAGKRVNNLTGSPSFSGTLRVIAGSDTARHQVSTPMLASPWWARLRADGGILLVSTSVQDGIVHTIALVDLDRGWETIRASLSAVGGLVGPVTLEGSRVSAKEAEVFRDPYSYRR